MEIHISSFSFLYQMFRHSFPNILIIQNSIQIRQTYMSTYFLPFIKENIPTEDMVMTASITLTGFLIKMPRTCKQFNTTESNFPILIK
jgi:hypothetical protein